MFKKFSEFDDLSEDSIMDAIAVALRKRLDTSVNYGYDALTDRYFFDATNYKGAYIDFKGKFLRDHRWDILTRACELLEEAVNKQKYKTISV